MVGGHASGTINNSEPASNSWGKHAHQVMLWEGRKVGLIRVNPFKGQNYHSFWGYVVRLVFGFGELVICQNSNFTK